jgi:hypothetical protein
MQKPLIVMALESEGQGLLEPLGLDVSTGLRSGGSCVCSSNDTDR